eukprot:scaffold170730_cov45-Attheya_sp.AAC.4
MTGRWGASLLVGLLMLGGQIWTTAGFQSTFFSNPTWTGIMKQQSSNRVDPLYMVASSSSSSVDPSSSAKIKPTNNNKNGIHMTPSPKYPTMRGSEVDSRKIVVAAQQHLTAVRLKHVLFASQDLATLSLLDVQAARVTFQDLALQISNCAETRDTGGEIGWVTISKKDDDDESINENMLTTPTSEQTDPNEHLDLILPKEARDVVLHLSSKVQYAPSSPRTKFSWTATPGDVVTVSSSRGHHLVQIVDVMVDVRKMATRKARSSYWMPEISLRDGVEGGTLTYKMETMGCQMNTADSERMEGQLQNLGIRPIRQEDEQGGKHPDLVILNTCSIRDHAEQKVYSYIGPHAKRKREGEDVTIIVAGCVAQQEGEALLRRAPEVDLVMGPQYANRIGDLLEDVQNGNQVVATEPSHIMEDSTKPRRGSSVAAWVNVIYGCNERCAFCIVPTTRGVEQSRPPESIMTEIEELVSQGYKEVTLLGQNIDAYGRDMIPKRKFSDLMRMAGSVSGLKRLRFVTSHPRYMSLGVVDAVAETETACENFHIPFQSGANEILETMGRGHTREKYLRIVARIRSRLPNASITADVIVGFPGETEDNFEETLSLMREVVFDS